MATVALIVTGDCERGALGQSLQKLFPGNEFVTQKVDSFTSADLSKPLVQKAGLKTNVERYATALRAALKPGRRQPAPDYVFGLDDLEVVNRSHPDAVITTLRGAISKELEICKASMNAATHDSVVQGLKDRCSFHLLAPMCEACFFGDPAALAAAGVGRSPVIDSAIDLEQFVTSDQEYLASEGEFPWVCAPAFRPYHPKHYLQFLLNPSPYIETDQGCKALAQVDWRVLMSKTTQWTFLRSFLTDLADALGYDQDYITGALNPLTFDIKNRKRILRNI